MQGGTGDTEVGGGCIYRAGGGRGGEAEVRRALVVGASEGVEGGAPPYNILNPRTCEPRTCEP